MEFVRYRCARPSADGRIFGVFGLVNILGRAGMLTEQEEQFRRATNRLLDDAYPDPCLTVPEVYDPAVNPRAAAWFRADALHLLRHVPGYLRILDAHSIAWEEVRTSDPGRIVYQDDVQVIAVPPASEQLSPEPR